MVSATILTLLSTGLSSILFSPEPNIPERPEYKKNFNTISMYGEKFRSGSILTVPVHEISKM